MIVIELLRFSGFMDFALKLEPKPMELEWKFKEWLRLLLRI